MAFQGLVHKFKDSSQEKWNSTTFQDCANPVGCWLCTLGILLQEIPIISRCLVKTVLVITSPKSW